MSRAIVVEHFFMPPNGESAVFETRRIRAAFVRRHMQGHGRSRAIDLSLLREAQSWENHGGGPLNSPQAGGQQLSVAMPELDIVGGCASRLEPEGFTDRERDRFSFGLTNLLAGLETPVAAMQQFMSDFVHQSC